jgi:glycosyltransferase involved in cell wall biosynthesis
MRVLLMAQFYPPTIGGEERHVRNLAHALSVRGHNVAVGTLGATGRPQQDMDGQVEVWRIGGVMQRMSALYSDAERRHAPPFPDPELSYRVCQIIRRFQPDIIHAHNWISHSVLPMAKLASIPVVLTLHDYGMVCAVKTLMRENVVCEGPKLPRCLSCAGTHYGTAKGSVVTLATRLTQPMQRWGISRLLAVSKAVADRNGLAESRIPYEVVPNFIPDTFTFDPDPELIAALPAEPYLLFVGDLRLLKGLHTLLDAYRKLIKPPPLVLIGRVCPDTPAQFPDNVWVFNNWPHSAIMEAWRRCLVGLAPSVWPDPCPTVVMEAMACGRPVIGTDMGGIPDIIENGVTGFVVPSADPFALAAAIQALIDDLDLSLRMGEAARVRVELFRAHSVVSRIERIYRDIVLEGGANAGRNDASGQLPYKTGGRRV